MILPSVSETLASVSRHPALESAISNLRRSASRERIVGLNGTAKALVAAQVAAELRRPTIVLAASGAKAETLAASLQFFYNALAGQESSQVEILPAVDVLPWQDAAPHAEILETRAVTLWRYSAGIARVVVAPIAAARMRLADASHYLEQARTLARDENVVLEEFVAHLRRVGYEMHDMVEMPGQFTVRGGIVDVFPAEAERPVRLELFGDSVESLREFDPNTQRSVRPIERVTLPPLLEYPSNWLTHGNGDSPALGFAPRAHSLLDLREDTVVIIDEPEAVEEAARKFVASAEESFQGSEHAIPAQLSDYLFTEDWNKRLESHARIELETLGANDSDPIDHAVSRQRAHFHGGSAKAHRRRRARTSGRWKSRRTRTVRGFVPRVRSPVPPGRHRKKSHQCAPGGRFFSGQCPGDCAVPRAVRRWSHIPRRASDDLRHRRSV